MRRPPTSWISPTLAGLLTLIVFLPGITWGLPTRADDAFLFGDRTPWTGAEILELAGGFEADEGRGADVDANPLTDRADVVLNATDAQRAEIVRRYRLFSEQPDEFITFAALAGMAERRDADPRLYQYGGLWVYPIGGLLGVADLLGLATVTGDLAHYLDHPADFGRFYVIARLYSAAWGAVGGALVWIIVRRLSNCPLAALVGVATYILLPAVITMGHEAKPHLPATVLMLLTCLLADNADRNPTTRNSALLGIAAGTAAGMLISAVLVWLVIPLALFLKPKAERSEASDRSGASLRSARGFALLLTLPPLTYALTNPYVLINALTAPDLLTSNLGNSTAMYEPTSPLETVGHAFALLIVGGGPIILLALAASTMLPALAYFRKRKPTTPLPIFLAVPAAAVLVQFVLLAIDDDGPKPAEYARFALFPIVCLGIAAVMFAHRLAEWSRPKAGKLGSIWLAVPVVLTLPVGLIYQTAFVVDDTRVAAAIEIEHWQGSTLRVGAEPAPYSMPPVDLWRWELVLDDDDPNVVATDTGPTPMTWANKPFSLTRPEASWTQPSASPHN
ncbi:MAG: glycosyltransferase family 39 protein [Planctomycetota bacterium]